MWLLLLVGVRTLLPSVNIPFALIFAPGARKRPTEEPESRLWLRKEFAYVGVVMRPFGEFLLFFITASVHWYFWGHSARKTWAGIDTASAMSLALLFPSLSLATWILAMNSRSLHSLIQQPPQVPPRRPMVISFLAFYTLGAIWQSTHAEGHLLSWTICSVFMMAFVLMLLKFAAPDDNHETPPDTLLAHPGYRWPLFLRFAVFLIALGAYQTLLRATLANAPATVNIHTGLVFRNGVPRVPSLRCPLTPAGGSTAAGGSGLAGFLRGPC